MERVRRERVRFQAAEMFAAGMRPPQVAHALRVSQKSAYAWCAAWREGGTDALHSSSAFERPWLTPCPGVSRAHHGGW
ncbi:helix-turn-helix domain-containing protein [Streptomyces sp. NPDC001137]|uniref:helix-turn-helix domain-containing protein n=1 Tax=Streptomyces sp. NPDC001137 TaxID=3154378 RepID=UPI003317100C